MGLLEDKKKNKNKATDQAESKGEEANGEEAKGEETKGEEVKGEEVKGEEKPKKKAKEEFKKIVFKEKEIGSASEALNLIKMYLRESDRIQMKGKLVNQASKGLA